MSSGTAALAALALGLAACSSAPKAPAAATAAIVLPFIENDFPKALAAARDARLPVFVEVWAPW